MKIERTMSAVHDALPPASASEFRTRLRRILLATIADMDVDALQVGLESLVLEFWAVASAWHSPNAAAATEAGERWVRGEDIGVVPAEEVFRRAGLTEGEGDG